MSYYHKEDNNIKYFKTQKDLANYLNTTPTMINRSLRKGGVGRMKNIGRVNSKRDVNLNKLAVFQNKDKCFHETWHCGRNIMNIPHPFRCICAGPPNCGKTGFIFNLIMNNDPYFEEIIVVHCDPEYTEEYDDIPCIMIDRIPAPDEFEGVKKTLVILDDLEYKNLNKEEKKNLDRLFGFVSTHKNISVCLTAQDVFNIPTGVRRCSNIFVLWKIDDLDAISMLCRRLNYSAKEIKYLFDKYIDNNHDSIMIDKTDSSPYPLRKNGTQVLELS